jgi:hypothetical protein
MAEDFLRLARAQAVSQDQGHPDAAAAERWLVYVAAECRARHAASKPVSQKAKRQRIADAGASIPNPINGGSNHGISKV